MTLATSFVPRFQRRRVDGQRRIVCYLKDPGTNAIVARGDAIPTGNVEQDREKALAAATARYQEKPPVPSPARRRRRSRAREYPSHALMNHPAVHLLWDVRNPGATICGEEPTATVPFSVWQRNPEHVQRTLAAWRSVLCPHCLAEGTRVSCSSRSGSAKTRRRL